MPTSTHLLYLPGEFGLREAANRHSLKDSGSFHANAPLMHAKTHTAPPGRTPDFKRTTSDTALRDPPHRDFVPFAKREIFPIALIVNAEWLLQAFCDKAGPIALFIRPSRSS